jgi:two-component system, cell cycle sensor histidine kinase and response regulator CckA
MSTIHKDVSCYSSSLLIQYARNAEIPSFKLFKGIESFQSILQNPLEWIDVITWNKLAENIEACFPQNPHVMYDIGMEMTLKQITNFQMLFLKIAPIKTVAAAIPRHMKAHINRTMVMYAQDITSSGLYLVTTPNNKNEYSSQICEFNKGCSLATVISKGYKNGKIEEVQCAARSNVHSCIYKVTWDQEHNFSEKLKNMFFFWFHDQSAIINHMEENHNKLESQYKEILSMKDFYSHIMSSMNESIVWLDVQGKINFANWAFKDLTGIDETSVVGIDFVDLFKEEKSVAAFGKILQQCDSEPSVLEIVFTSKSGTGSRIGLTSIKWVPSNVRPSGYLISIRDITETKKIQQQLILVESRYRALYENSPALIIGFDTTGHFVFANPAMVEQSGYSEDELKTMSVRDLIAPNAEISDDRIITNVLSEPSHLQEVHFKTKSGEWKSIALNSYHIFDENHNFIGVGGIGVDITETKRLNEQLIKTQRMELLGQLAGGLAHDFNNILFSINGYSQIIMKQSSEKTIQEYADTIHLAGDRASTLVKNLLSFSKGGYAGKVEKFDVRAVINEAKAMMKGVVPSVITVDMNVPESPLYVLGDSGKIHQCIMNLCMNAKDALGIQTGGYIKMRAAVADNKPGFIHIQVEDSGPGIPPDIIEKIFDPFFTTKRKKGGTGLGLSVVYGIVKSHKGDISVESHPGEGTVFTIELPIYNENNIPDISALTRNVFLLTQDSIINKYCSDILQYAGYNFSAYTTVHELQSAILKHEQEPLIVMADLPLPDKAVPDSIAECGAPNSKVACLWICGADNSHMLKDIPGAVVLNKPFPPAALLEALKALH